MGIATRVTPKTRQQLYALAYPETANQPEAISHIVYDTQSYTSGATTTLTFFATQQSDPTLGNLDQAGAFTDPQWFELHNWGLDIIADASASGAGADETGILDDIQKLMLVGRPIFTFFMSNKQYGPYPLSFLHGSGGAQGVIGATLTAPESVQVGNNSFPDGGWNWRGNVIIPPKVGFKVVVQWAAAQTLNNGNTNLRLFNAGVLHRRVL